MAKFKDFIAEAKPYNIGKLHISATVHKKLTALIDDGKEKQAARLLASTEGITYGEALAIVKAFFDPDSGEPKLTDKAASDDEA